MENISDKALAQILRNEGTGSSAVEKAADRLEAPDIRGNPSTEPITKLEQFTMAAMIEVAKKSNDADFVARISVDIAQATIAQLAEKETHTKEPWVLYDEGPTTDISAESLPDNFVDCINALAGISDPVAWVMAMKEVQRLTVAEGFPVELANAWLDAKAAEEGS